MTKLPEHLYDFDAAALADQQHLPGRLGLFLSAGYTDEQVGLEGRLFRRAVERGFIEPTLLGLGTLFYWRGIGYQRDPRLLEYPSFRALYARLTDPEGFARQVHAERQNGTIFREANPAYDQEVMIEALEAEYGQTAEPTVILTEATATWKATAPPRSWYHQGNGWFFGRRDDGAIVIEYHRIGRSETGSAGHPLGQMVAHLTILETEWASILAHVSAGADLAATYQRALALHRGEG